MIVYKTTNLVNGKIYVGQTIKDSTRYLGSGSIMLKAIKKYGHDNFKRETLEVCNTQKELDEREIFWIDKLNSTNPEIGYNISPGGCGVGRHSLQTKEKISRTLSGRRLSDETKIKMSNAIRPPVSNETKKKLSILKLESGGFNGQHTEETKQKISESLKNGKAVTGSKHGSARKINVRGTVYGCIKEASEALNISRYLVKKLGTFV